MSDLDDHALQTSTVAPHESGNMSDKQPVMSMLWPLLGGNHTDADTWQEIDDAVRSYGDQRYQAAIDDVVAMLNAWGEPAELVQRVSQLNRKDA